VRTIDQPLATPASDLPAEHNPIPAASAKHNAGHQKTFRHLMANMHLGEGGQCRRRTAPLLSDLLSHPPLRHTTTCLPGAVGDTSCDLSTSLACNPNRFIFNNSKYNHKISAVLVSLAGIGDSTSEEHISRGCESAYMREGSQNPGDRADPECHASTRARRSHPTSIPACRCASD